MADMRGANAFIKIGAEVTWGTEVARTETIMPSPGFAGLMRKINYAPIPSLGVPGDPVSMAMAHYVESDVSEGDWGCHLPYDGNALELLYYAMGAVATVTGTPNVHTFTLDGQGLPGITWEQVGGTHASMDPAEVFVGVVITSFEISCKAGEIAQIKFSLIGKSSGGKVAAGTATIETPSLLQHHQAGQLTIGAVSLTLDSFALKVDLKRKGYNTLGSVNIAEPVPDDFAEVTLDIEYGLSTNAVHGVYLADTGGDAVLKFTGTGTKEFEITVLNGYVSDLSDDQGKVGRLTQKATIKGQSDGTDYGLKIVVKNGNGTNPWS